MGIEGLVDEAGNYCLGQREDGGPSTDRQVEDCFSMVLGVRLDGHRYRIVSAVGEGQGRGHPSDEHQQRIAGREQASVFSPVGEGPADTTTPISTP